MATTVGQVMELLDASFDFSAAADWDPVGLQLGDPEVDAEPVAVCHEVTETVVDRAVEAGVGLLVAYHPLLFEPTNRLVAGPSAPGRAVRLLREGVAVAVVHTAFDAAPGGCADALADTLGLMDVSGFGPFSHDDPSARFAGRRGSLSEPSTLGEFAAMVSDSLGTPVRVAGAVDQRLASVAVVPGSGSSFLPEAAGVVDVVVTGDVSHHRARGSLDRGVAVVDAGHTPTERPGVRALYAAVSKMTPAVLDLVEIDPDPWKER